MLFPNELSRIPAPIVNNFTQMIPLTLFRPIEHPIDFYKMKLGLCIAYILKGHRLKLKKKNKLMYGQKMEELYKQQKNRLEILYIPRHYQALDR